VSPIPRIGWVRKVSVFAVRGTALAAGLALGGLVPSAVAAADWPSFRGPAHDGKSPDQGLLKEWPQAGPALLWKAGGIGKGFSSPSVSGGVVYITGEKGDKLVLTALDMSGKTSWTAEAGGICRNVDGSRGSATIDGKTLFLLSGDGVLGCYDTAGGARLWSVLARDFGGSPGGWGYAESVLIQGNLAIFKPGGKNCIVALDKTNGKQVWASSGFEAGPEYASCLPVTFGDLKMVVTGTQQGLVAVGVTDGKLLWQNAFAAGNTANCPTPAYSDGYVFWANGYGAGGVCVKLEAGGKATEAWKTREMVCHHGGYIIEGGYIYGNHEGGYACLDLKTGEKKWFEPAVGKGSLCWADGMLYLFGEGGGQAALATCSPQGLQVKGRVKVEGNGPSWAHPVVIGGRLYLRYDETLYCFDVKAGK